VALAGGVLAEGLVGGERRGGQGWGATWRKRGLPAAAADAAAAAAATAYPTG